MDWRPTPIIRRSRRHVVEVRELRLSRAARRVASLLAVDPNLTPSELALRLNVGKQTVYNAVSCLRAAGILSRRSAA